MKHSHIFLGLLLVVSMMSCHRSTSPKQEEAPIDTIPMMIMQIQKTSKLYTSEYQLHKIITYDDQMALKGGIFSKSFKIDLPMGHRKIAIPMSATVKAYIDFSKFSSKNISKNGEKLEVILPDPVVIMTSTQIDHEAVKKKESFFRHNFTDEEITHIQQRGRKEMIDDMARLGILYNARQNAARMLIPLFANMGYKEDQIIITFRKHFQFDDFKTLIRSVE